MYKNNSKKNMFDDSSEEMITSGRSGYQRRADTSVKFF